jgi:hypothetical protein
MSTFPATRVGSINRALVRAGCLTLSGAETQHPSGPAILLLYDTVLTSLAGYPWQHFKTFAKLSGTAAPAGVQWSRQFTLPADRQDMPFAYFDRADCKVPFMVFEPRDNQIFTDAAELWCRYSRIVEPGLWPGYFMDLFTLNLAAEYALAIREDERLRTMLLRECFGPPEMHGQGGRYAYATSIDSQKQPSPQAGNGSDPFTSAFRSGG